MATIAEQIAAFEAKRVALVSANEAIMEKSAEEGTTLDADQEETFDGNQADIEAIDKHLVRLRSTEKTLKTKAIPAAGDNAGEAGVSRGGDRIQIRSQEKLPPGVEFARAVKCLGLAKGSIGEALSYAKARFGENANVVGLLTGAQRNGKFGMEKAEIPAGATVSGNWAEYLVGDETTAFADFVEFLRPSTILGKFGTNGIPSLRNVPFRTALITQSAGMSGYWVGEGKAKPVTKGAFTRTTLEPLKVANICIVTDELLRSSSPSAEMVIRDDLAAALRERLDIDFIDPSKSASAGVSPASVTYGAQAIAATSYTDADDVRLDVRSVMQYFINADNPPTTGVWVMSTGNALALSMLVNGLGQPEFSGIGMNGGQFFGLPVITSEHAGSYVTLVNASDIYLGDEGGISIDMSREASVEMLDSSLTGDSIGVVPGTAASTVSLWQTNSVGFLAERTVNWARRRATSVVVLSGVAWGGAVSSS
jgi:hypothetical protein